VSAKTFWSADVDKTKGSSETDAERKISPSPKPAAPVTGNADVTSEDDVPAGRRKDNETDANRSDNGGADRAEEGL
jgi:hypothetical protein